MYKQYNRKIINADYVATLFDEAIEVDSSVGPISISLPAITSTGLRKTYFITDIGELAGTNPITISSVTTDLFNNGNGNFVINSNNGTVTLESDSLDGVIGRWVGVSGWANFTNALVREPGDAGVGSAQVKDNGNSAQGDYSLVSGRNNSATGDYASVLGGFSNAANADYSNVQSSSLCTIQTGQYGSIINSDQSDITGMSTGPWNSIFHGDRMHIQAGSNNMFVGGSQSNIYAGSYNFLPGQFGSSFYGSYGFATPGNQQIRSDNSMVSGSRGLAYEHGQRVHAKPTTTPGYFGVSQITDNLRGGLSLDATPVNIIDNTKFSTFGDQVRFIKIMLTAVQTAGAAGAIGDCASFEIQAMVRRNGALTFVGTPTVTPLFSDAGAVTWSAAIAVSGNGINLIVTGEADKTINWLASLRTQDTGYRNIQP